jgi:hypothetical protein
MLQHNVSVAKLYEKVIQSLVLYPRTVASKNVATVFSKSSATLDANNMNDKQLDVHLGTTLIVS